MKRLIIDRFEGDYAVIEYGEETFDFPKELLPSDAKQGDLLTLSITVDKQATDDRRQAIRDKMERLRKKRD